MATLDNLEQFDDRIIEMGGLKDEEIEDPDVCDICLDGEVYDDNEIIFCDKCNVPVHQLCYGVTSIPEGAWYCYVCAQNLNPLEVQCELCGFTGGAYKYCDRTDKWVHPLCANWIPEIYETTSKKGVPIINLKNLDLKRYRLKCNLCNIKGACVQCCYGRCSTPVHPWCALRTPQGFTRRIIKDNDGNILWEIFCKAHAKAVSDPLKKSKHNRVKYEEIQDYLDFDEEPEVINPRPRRTFDDIKETKFSIVHDESVPYTDDKSKLQKEEKVESKLNETNFIIPNYLEWPGITEGEGMDLDHFWNCVSSYYVEDHSDKWLEYMIAPFTDISALYQSKIDNSNILESLNEIKTYFGSERDRNNALLWDKRDALLLKVSHLIKLLKKDHNLPLEQQPFINRLQQSDSQVDTIENVNIAEEKVDQLSDKKHPIVLDHHHFSLNNSFYYQDQDETENINDESLIESQQINHSSLLRAVIDSENRYGVDLKIQVIQPSESLNEGQSNLLDIQTLRDNEMNRSIIPYTPDQELLPDLNSYKVDCSLQSFHKIDSSMEFSLLDHKIKPKDECSELSMIIALDTLAYDNLISSMQQHIKDLLESNQIKELSNKNLINNPNWNSIYSLFVKQQIWRRIGITLIKGIRDQSSDFNKIEREDLPPSWQIQVNGRPSQEAANEDDEDGPHEDAICMVCFDGTSTEGNRILFCDGCNATIHQLCYGIGEIPEGDYYCDRCKYVQDFFADGDKDPEFYDLRNMAKCCLCPLQHGGLKATLDGRWVHLICAFWSKSAIIEDMREMGPIDISNVSFQPLKTLSSLSQPETGLETCNYCKMSGGYIVSCIDCAEQNIHSNGDSIEQNTCSIKFHPLCSWYFGNYTQAQLTDPTYQGNERQGLYPSGFDYCFLCDTHSTNKRSHSNFSEEQRTLRLKYKIKDEDLSAFPGKIKKRKKNNKKKQSGTSQKRQTVGGPQQKDLSPDVYSEKQCGICMLPISNDLFNTDNDFSVLEKDLIEELEKVNSDSFDYLKSTNLANDNKIPSDVDRSMEIEKEQLPSVDASTRMDVVEFTDKENNREKEKLDVNVNENTLDVTNDANNTKNVICTRKDTITCSKCKTFTVHINCLECFESDIDENSWLCTGCQQSDSYPHCVVCPRVGGYLCHTIDNLFIHAYCAKNSPGSLRITNEKRVDIRAIPKENKKQKCIVCNRKSGVTLHCCADGCDNYFHPLCGVRNGKFLLRTRGGIRQAFCSNHIPETIERLSNGRWIDNNEIYRFRYGLDRTRLIIDMVVRREKFKKLLYKAESELFNLKINKLLNKALGRKNIHGEDDMDLEELNFETESEDEDEDDDELQPATPSKSKDNDSDFISFDKITSDKKYFTIKSDITEEEMAISSTWVRPGMNTVLKLPKNVKVYFSCLTIKKKDSITSANARAFKKYYQDLLDRVEESSRSKTGIFFDRREEDLFESSLGPFLINNLKLKDREFEDFCSRNKVHYDRISLKNAMGDFNTNKRKASELENNVDSDSKRKKADIDGNCASIEPDFFDQIMAFESKEAFKDVSSYMPCASKNPLSFDNCLLNINTLINPNDWFNYSPKKLPNLERLLRDMLNFLMEYVEYDEEPAPAASASNKKAPMTPQLSRSNKKDREVFVEGRLLAADFLDIPYDLIPDYDLNVRTVMTLKIMSNKLSQHLYLSFGAFAFDFYTMLNNGRSVTNPSSWTWKDTRKLAQVFEESKINLLLNPRCLQSRVSSLAIDSKRAGNRNRASQGSINMRCLECSSLMEVLNWPLDFETSSMELSTENPPSSPLKVSKTPSKKIVEESENLDIPVESKRGRTPKSSQPSVENYNEDQIHWNWMCGSCIGKLGEALVGRKVKIWWIDDYKSYSGTLTAMDEVSRCHCVLYDDQEWEFINLSVEPVLFSKNIDEI